MHRYYFVDLETTVNGGPDGTSPEAHWQGNNLLMCGWQKEHHPMHIDTTPYALLLAMRQDVEMGDTPVIVAHNAKFDIKHLMRHEPAMRLLPEIRAWCTMTWEYRRSGHASKFIGLEALADQYGIEFKKSLDLGALLKAGVKMEDIPKDALETYLREDVRVLKEIWEHQVCSIPSITANFHTIDMDYILPLARMELAGLKIDEPEHQRLLSSMAQVVQYEENKMVNHIRLACEWQDGSAVADEDFTEALGTKSKYIKTHAGRTLSFLLTGVPAVLSITNKWKLQFRAGKATPFHKYVPSVYKNSTHLGYPIDEAVLAADPNWITDSAGKHRKANKILGTYLAPFAESMAVSKGCIYPKLNTTATGTGRLSSSGPNGQNIPPIVRNLIVPHLSKHIYEIDFKQLEMVAVACISGCPDMLAALKRGDDLHYLSGKKVYRWNSESDMTDMTRRVVKAVNFGVLYGGKAQGLSIQTGVDKAIIQQLIDGFYTAFPGVARWQKQIFQEVVDTMQPYDVKDGAQRYGSMWTLPLGGRKFQFVENEAPKWLQRKTKRKWSFSPTHTSNYPIQGFAGGDIVMYALSWLYKNHNYTQFLLTVHDSIIIESDLSQTMIEDITEQMCKATAKHFNLPLDLHCDVERGAHWK